LDADPDHQEVLERGDLDDEVRVEGKPGEEEQALADGEQDESVLTGDG
jgi:hypothetical protein